MHRAPNCSDLKSFTVSFYIKRPSSIVSSLFTLRMTIVFRDYDKWAWPATKYHIKQAQKSAMACIYNTNQTVMFSPIVQWI